MDTFEAIVVNETTIKIDNRTDYYLDKWLYSDYGFRMFYKPARGIAEVYWKELLTEYNFDDPDHEVGKSRFKDIATRDRSIDFHRFLTRNFVVEFVSGDEFYCFFFDHKEWIVFMTNDGGFWNRL